MSDPQERTTRVLEEMARRLNQALLAARHRGRAAALAGAVRQPCVVAVVGQVKQGKSSFINALLGRRLAKVGTLEATATINEFHFGTGPDDQPRIVCRWRNGPPTEVDQAFADSLQGHDPETLRRAAGVECLQFFVADETLRDIILVDTPGTGSVVSAHQDVAAEHLGLIRQLVDRNNARTEDFKARADAVIYLVGAVALARHEEMLQQFAAATGGRARALNAVGVMAKIDLDERLLERREERAGQLAADLRHELNTVVPVSAALHEALRPLRADAAAGLQQLLGTLRQIPPEILGAMLENEDIYLDYEAMTGEPCPVVASQRRALYPKGQMPWAVFRTLGRECTRDAADATEVLARLEDIAGFGPLMQVLRQHFLQRAQLLRCFHTAAEAGKLLERIRFEELPALRRQADEERRRLARFTRFLETAGGDRQVAAELSEFLRRHLGGDERPAEHRAVYERLDADLGQLLDQLQEANDDFLSLQLLGGAASELDEPEAQELRALFGQYGGAPEHRVPAGCLTRAHLHTRQLHWTHVAEYQARRGSARQKLASHAADRYGRLLGSLEAEVHP